VRRRIGIDVGGTNTDAVLLEDDGVAAAVKTPTTADVTTGITRALAALVAQAPAARLARAVMIGTTHFTNAVVQRRDLATVAAIRIGLPSGASLPPFTSSTAARSCRSTRRASGTPHAGSATRASARWRSRPCSRR
jgi:N-methylhydantoinase A/oxoprolinase/acetone carboxylase beta subunit